jgi:hypothetical protein
MSRERVDEEQERSTATADNKLGEGEGKMTKRVAMLIGGWVAFQSLSALATHNEPAKASLMKGALVTAYEPCNGADAATSKSVPACTSVVRSNPDCGFASRGRGTVSARHKAGDVAFRATLRGLDDGCDNHTLQLRVTVRATVEDCGDASCTLVQVPKVPVASCVVDPAGNSCSINSTLNAILPNAIGSGTRLGVEILDVDVFDASTNRPAFRGGILVP